ncbi:hypothetical protein HMI54_009914 [Coelomomyces lativittatus]|nr:hypothetical protein HMI54_009914 [Coelomomyces lativittatus]
MDLLPSTSTLPLPWSDAYVQLNPNHLFTSCSYSVHSKVLIVFPALGESCTPYIHFPWSSLLIPNQERERWSYIVLTPPLLIPYLSSSSSCLSSNEEETQEELNKDSQEYYQWFHSFDLDNGEVLPYTHPTVVQSMTQTRLQVFKLLHALLHPPFSFQATSMYFVGLGQGGLMALDVALMFDHLVGGVISFNGPISPYSVYQAHQPGVPLFIHWHHHLPTSSSSMTSTHVRRLSEKETKDTSSCSSHQAEVSERGEVDYELLPPKNRDKISISH